MAEDCRTLWAQIPSSTLAIDADNLRDIAARIADLDHRPQQHYASPKAPV